MASIYVCKNGKLIPRDPEKTILSKPTVINYTYSISKLYQNQCLCKMEIEKLKKQFEFQLNQKSKEVDVLVNRIAQKQLYIEKLQQQILSLKNSNTPEVNDMKYSLNFEKVWDKMDKSLNSTVVSNFELYDLSSNENIKTTRTQIIGKTEREMDECFNKTNELMNQIDSIMKKKRKYDFHNAINIESSIIEQLQNSQEKSQEDTQQIMMEQTFCMPNLQYYEADSLDMTNYSSDHNFRIQQNAYRDEDFYDKILNDSIILKHTILQMREESLKQIKEVEQYYQKQLKISYDELQREKLKNSLIQMTKTKLTQLTDKGRRALAQLELDQNENLCWDIGEKKNSRFSPRTKVQTAE